MLTVLYCHSKRFFSIGKTSSERKAKEIAGDFADAANVVLIYSREGGKPAVIRLVAVAGGSPGDRREAVERFETLYRNRPEADRRYSVLADDFAARIDKPIVATRIRKRDDEFVVEAFDEDGRRPEADYFTNDRDDAKATAAAMKNAKTFADQIATLIDAGKR